MKKSLTPASATLARVAAVRARYSNPQSAVKIRLAKVASIAARFNIKTAAQLQREHEDAEIEAAAPPVEDEPFFDDSMPASLEVIEREARLADYCLEVAEAKAERAVLLAHKEAISRRRLQALRVGAVKAAERLTEEFWTTFHRLAELEEILIWETVS